MPLEVNLTDKGFEFILTGRICHIVRVWEQQIDEEMTIDQVRTGLLRSHLNPYERAEYIFRTLKQRTGGEITADPLRTGLLRSHLSPTGVLVNWGSMHETLYEEAKSAYEKRIAKPWYGPVNHTGEVCEYSFQPYSEGLTLTVYHPISGDRFSLTSRTLNSENPGSSGRTIYTFGFQTTDSPRYEDQRCELRFVIDGSEWDRLKHANFWDREEALGGRYTYRFGLTTVVTIVHISDNVEKHELDLTDYSHV
jgi:hypothetical protein